MQQHASAQEMELTAFRGDMTAVIDRLDETGPVRLTKYNDTVAEIRSATPEGDRRYTQDVLSTLEYLAGLDETESDIQLVSLLTALGIDTLALLTELAVRHKAHADSGVTFSEYPEHCLPAEGRLTIDETLARLYFGDDYPESATEPYAWFLACARIQEEAARRSMPTTLPTPNAYVLEQPTFVELATASGHTPKTLTDFALKAMEDGVTPERLADMLGNEPVPADVLAMDGYSEWNFEQLKKFGLPHAEVVSLFRMGLTTTEAMNLASAGIRTADEIWELIGAGVNTEMALRASAEGVPPEEWKAALPKIQRLKYKGASTSSFDDRSGILPFRLLIQAADEGLSLVRWDDNTLKVRADQTNKYFHANAAKRQIMHPWVHVYPDRILDVARAGLSPTYLAAFGKLMEHRFDETTPSEEFVTTAIEAHKLGLTAAMADAISRSDGKRPKFTAGQLLEVLRAGLSDLGTAHYLADEYADPQAWLTYLDERRERQLMTDAFVATVENTETWKAIQDAAQALKRLFDIRAMSGRYLKTVVQKFLAGESLDDQQLMVLLSYVTRAHGDRSALPKSWYELHDHQTDVIRELRDNFDQSRKAPQG